MAPTRPKILLAPMNFAGMPVALTRALRGRGYTAAHLQYGGAQPSALAYDLDRRLDLGGQRFRAERQLQAVAAALDEGFDIFHFWNRSLVFRNDYGAYSGADIPLIKARGRRIVHRFTGFDLRLPSRDLALNPHSPFRHGQPPIYDEDLVKAYQDFLREHVDRFVVQDPEMGQFFPEAETIPRALDLDSWAYVGVERKDRPLVVHAPTNSATKGTRYVLAAVAALKDEGLPFDFRLVQGMAHAEARRLYAEADVIVDQLLIGATGVLTLEAWALGKPVVVNLRRDLFEPFYGTSDLPVANATPETVQAELRRVLTDFDLRQDLSRRGRALVEAHHDIAHVVERYIDLYEDTFQAPPRTPTGDGDLRYLALQIRRAETAESFLSRWRAGYRNDYRRERQTAAALNGRVVDHGRFDWGAASRVAGRLIRRDLRNLARHIGRAGKRKVGK